MRSYAHRLIGLFLVAALAVSMTGNAMAAEKIKVLVVTGGHGFEKEPFFKMFKDNADITFTAAAHSKTNASAYDRDDLLSYDVVVTYDMPQEITETQKKNFLWLFDKGVGLVVLHHALGAYQRWPEYAGLIGGHYDEPDPKRPGTVTEKVGWKHDEEIPVVILATNHPVTAGLKNFTIHDEIYWGFRVQPDVTPLLTTTHPKSGKPLAWTRTQGKSRVVFIQLGHGPEAHNNESYRKLLAQSIRWTAKRPESQGGSNGTPQVFLLDANHLQATRQRIRDGDKEFAPALAALKRDANGALKSRPASVVEKTNVPPSGDKHDYMSIAPYFWPDPAKSNGLPYLRRDGERNPANRTSDRRALGAMIENVETLALAWYFTGDEIYAMKATQLLRVWFLDPATRMNPNFEFAQAVPGLNTGRGTGLIETAGLTSVVDAVGLLAGSKAWTDADQRGLREWFAQFLDWMRTSKNGRDEAAAKNNHGTYYDVQAVSFALFIGRRELATNILQAAGTNRIARQIEPDGRQPLELARTKSWGYSTMNLRGLMSLATLGEQVGVDWWHYETPDGRGIRKAVDYLLPFALRERKWPHQQLGGWSPDSFFPLLRRAAAKLPDACYRELAMKFAQHKAEDRSQLLRAPLDASAMRETP